MAMLVAKLRGFASEVFKELGTGFSESVYHQAMLVSLRQIGITEYETERVLPVVFKGITVGYHRSDIVLPKEKTVIELKAISRKTELPEIIQVKSYLKSLGWEKDGIGVVINFPQPSTTGCKEEIEFLTVIQGVVNRD